MTSSWIASFGKLKAWEEEEQHEGQQLVCSCKITPNITLGIRDQYYTYIGTPPPPPQGLPVDSTDMLCLDSDGEESLAGMTAQTKPTCRTRSKVQEIQRNQLQDLG